jgi:hypothetical protein
VDDIGVPFVYTAPWSRDPAARSGTASNAAMVYSKPLARVGGNDRMVVLRAIPRTLGTTFALP